MRKLTTLSLLAFLPLLAQTRAHFNHNHGRSDIEEFFQFEKDFGKLYSSQRERWERFGVFSANLRRIQSHNDQPDVTYTLGITKFADMSDEEFKLVHLQGYSGSPRMNLLKVKPTSNDVETTDLPTEVDWRKRGVVTPVKDQGRCGSCWAFGTVEQVESYYALANNGSQTVLAPQQLVSCMDNPNQCGGTGGCSGATAELGMGYISQYGLVKESDLPYESGTSGDDETCPSDLTHPEVKVQDFGLVPSNDVEAVKKHLATVGPLAVNVDASSFALYTGGVFHGCDYSKDIDINHVVQLVGYGTDDSGLGDYWLIRNSWGPNWGEDGYIRVKRESTEVCGFDSRPQDGVGCHGQTDTVRVCGMCGILYDTVYPIGVYKVKNSDESMGNSLDQFLN